MRHVPSFVLVGVAIQSIKSVQIPEVCFTDYTIMGLFLAGFSAF